MKCIRMQTKSLLYRYVLMGYMLCLWHMAARLDLSLQICRGHAVALPSFDWVLLYICLIALLRIGLLRTSDTAPLHYCIIACYAIVCGACCCRVLCNCGLEIGSDIVSKILHGLTENFNAPNDMWLMPISSLAIPMTNPPCSWKRGVWSYRKYC